LLRKVNKRNSIFCRFLSHLGNTSKIKQEYCNLDKYLCSIFKVFFKLFNNFIVFRRLKSTKKNTISFTYTFISTCCGIYICFLWTFFCNNCDFRISRSRLIKVIFIVNIKFVTHLKLLILYINMDVNKPSKLDVSNNTIYI